MFEYLAQVQSAVRRLNYRLETLSNNVGKDSPIVQKIMSEVDLYFDGNYRFKNGVAQLVKPQQIYNDEDMNKALQHLDRTVKTWGDYKREYEKEYEHYKEQAEFFGDTPVPIGEFINVYANVDKIMEWMYPTDTAEKEKALNIMQQKGRRKSYEELASVIKMIRS